MRRIVAVFSDGAETTASRFVICESVSVVARIASSTSRRMSENPRRGCRLPSTCAESGGVSGKAFISDVAVKPGTNGAVVDAVVGWRAGSNCNGFFESTDTGQTFAMKGVLSGTGSAVVSSGLVGRPITGFALDQNGAVYFVSRTPSVE